MTYGDNTMSPTKIGERNETFGSLESTREVSELRMKYIIINGLNDEMTHHAPHWACAWMVVRNYMEQTPLGSASDEARLFHGRRAGPGQEPSAGEREGAPLPWNKRFRGALATGSGCSMGDERGRATGGAEGAGCGSLARNGRSRRRRLWGTLAPSAMPHRGDYETKT